MSFDDQGEKEAMPSNRTFSSVPSTPLESSWQGASFDAKRRRTQRILSGEYFQPNGYNTDVENQADNTMSRPDSPKVTAPSDPFRTMESRENGIPRVGTQSPSSSSSLPRNARRPDGAPITTIRLRTGSSSSSPAIQTFLFRASREGYPSVPPAFTSQSPSNSNFGYLQPRQSTDYEMPDASERRNSSPMSVANLLSTPNPPVNVMPNDKTQPKRGGNIIRFRNYFQTPPPSGRGTRKVSQSEHSASERSSTPQIPSREDTVIEANNISNRDVSPPKLRLVSKLDPSSVTASETAPLPQADSVVAQSDATSESSGVAANAEVDDSGSVRRSGRVRKPVVKMADEIFDKEPKSPIVKAKKQDTVASKTTTSSEEITPQKSANPTSQFLTPSPENHTATDAGNVRSSGRVRKPTLKAIEALQSQAQDRRERDKSPKSQTPPADSRDTVLSKSHQQPTAAASDVSKSDKRKGLRRLSDSKDESAGASHISSAPASAALSRQKSVSRASAVETKKQLDATVTSTPKSTPSPRKPSPKPSPKPISRLRKPTKAQLSLLAKQLFELAAAAITPESLDSPGEDIDIEKMRAEFFAKSKTPEPVPEAEPEQEQFDSIQPDEQPPPVVEESHHEENNTLTIDPTLPPALPPGFNLVDSSVALDHPEHPRPWTDSEGWTHTGHANEYAEEAVVVPNSFAWVPEAAQQPNLDVPSPPPRVGSRVQVEKDHEFRYPPVLGGRNGPYVLGGRFVPENVMQEGLRAKAVNCALQKGIAVDPTMTFDEVRLKIEQHDGPEAPRRSWLKLVITNSKTLEDQDIQDNKTAEDHRKRRQSAPANMAGNASKAPRSRKRAHAAIDNDGQAETPSTPEQTPQAKKARSTGKAHALEKAPDISPTNPQLAAKTSASSGQKDQSKKSAIEETPVDPTTPPSKSKAQAPKQPRQKSDASTEQTPTAAVAQKAISKSTGSKRKHSDAEVIESSLRSVTPTLARSTSNKRKRGGDSADAEDAVAPNATAHVTLDPNVSSSSKRRRVEENTAVEESPSVQARPRRKNAGALLAQLQNELEPANRATNRRSTPGLQRAKSVSNLSRSVSVNRDAEAPKAGPSRKNST